MSALQRKKAELINAESGGLPPRPVRSTTQPGRHAAQSRYRDLTPVGWRRYFTSEENVHVESGDVFHVYRSGDSGPLLVLLHGGGFSGLTWAVFTEQITRSVECQVLAIDLRGHGETTTSDDSDLSAERQVSDVMAVVSTLYSAEAPAALLVGHSMGGALAVHAAHAWSPGPLVGLVVIDVVEGTAMEALGSMHTFLRSRPDRFHSIQHAIEWCLKSGAVRNADSARVSVPGQIKNVQTGAPATQELSNPPAGLHPPPASSHTAQLAPPGPARAADSIAEEEEEDSEETAEDPAPRDPSRQAPTTAAQATYTWRIDLASSECHWAGWFSGLSTSFLTAPPPKVLMLAGIDRLDRDLSVGQMQGKFQLQVMPRSGHAVHEDVPDRVAGVVANFMVRNKLAQARHNFHPILPGC